MPRTAAQIRQDITTLKATPIMVASPEAIESAVRLSKIVLKDVLDYAITIYQDVRVERIPITDQAFIVDPLPVSVTLKRIPMTAKLFDYATLEAGQLTKSLKEAAIFAKDRAVADAKLAALNKELSNALKA